MLWLVADTSAPPEDGASSDVALLSGRVALPLVFASFLLLAAPLVWAGSFGSPGALLGLFYGGIGLIGVGFVLAFIVGLFVLSSLILVGVVWIALERAALSLHGAFAGSAIGLVAIAAVLLALGYRPLRAALERRSRWRSLTGGSVAPSGPPPPGRSV